MSKEQTMAEFLAEVLGLSEGEFIELGEAGFLPVVRWKRPSKSDKLYRTADALREARKTPKTAPKNGRASPSSSNGEP